MEIIREQHGMVAVLLLRGALNATAVDVLLSEVASCKSTGSFRIVLGMSDVSFIDSAGLETIQTLLVDLSRRDGDLFLADVNSVCRDILSATRMESLVRICEDVPSAVRSFA